MADAAGSETAAPEREPVTGGTPPLARWTLATANTILFVLALLVPSYASGGLSDVLPTLETAVGVVVFLYLWLVVWATTRRLLDRVDPAQDPLPRLTLWAGAFGALDGIAFLVGTVLVLGVPTALTTTLELLSVVLIAAIGTPIAAVVGAVVGVVAMLVDLAMLWAADAVSPTGPDRQ